MYKITTSRYALRPVCPSDAADLLRCYSDPAAVRRMNSDNCTGSFLTASLEDMQRAIGFWQNDPVLERLSILSLTDRRAVGTIEYHLKTPELLVLRLDLCSEHEQTDRIAELLDAVCEEGFCRYPTAQRIVLKAFPQDEARVQALPLCHFDGETELLGFPHYYEKKRPFRGVAYCGLVCAYCSERVHCGGCKTGNCADHEGCKLFLCGMQKGHSGCGDCPDFPCDAPILNSLRIRTFAAYAREHGDDALLRHLARKAAQGVQYHRDGLTGDYDGFSGAEELIAFLES